MKIVDDSKVGKYIASLMEGVDEKGNPVPVPATLSEIEKLDETLLKVIVEFGPGIYGKFICGRDVKVDGEYNFDETRFGEDKPHNLNKIEKGIPEVSTTLLLYDIGFLFILFLILIIFFNI